MPPTLIGQFLQSRSLKSNDSSLWLVKSSFGGAKCAQGTPIRDGDLIRLEHVNTVKYLHSHHHQSPLSGQQEVSAYVGNDGRGDTGALLITHPSSAYPVGDNWKVEINGGGAWKRGETVRLLHVDTNKYLHSHNQKVRWSASLLCANLRV